MTVAPSVAPSDSDPVLPPAASVSRPEATIRALVSGVGIGVILAAANVYTSLKVGIIDGGGITAALLAFGIFAGLRRSGRSSYGALENNITQTTASSAAVMSYVTGVVGPIPALAFLGIHFSSAAIVVFGAAVAVLGIFAAGLLRRRLVVEEALPFPTGAATGEVIETLFGGRRAAMRRILLLVSGAAVAGAVAWFRDGRPTIIPQGFMFGGTVAGVAAATLGLGFACSPLMLSIGAMIGMRTAAGLLLGAAVARIVLAPWLLHTGVVADVEFGTVNTWVIWPSLGLMLAGSFLPLLLEGGTIVRSLRQLVSVLRPSTATPQAKGEDPTMRFWSPLLAASLVVMLLVGWFAFGVGPLVMLIAVALSLVLANVAARATGETDFAPAGSMGTIGQIATASRGMAGGLMGGSVAMGMTTQTSQMLWAFRAGHRVGASPRAQIGAQLLGALVGAVVTVPVYAVIAATYGLANEKMPTTSALSWKATAVALHGLSGLPVHGATAALIGIGAGAALTLLSRARLGRWLPSAAAIGVGFMLPFFATLAVFAGAALALAVQAIFRRRGLDQASILALASGGLVGESIVGVIIAILMSAGLL